MLPPVYAVRHKDNYLVESANYRALIVWCFVGANRRKIARRRNLLPALRRSLRARPILKLLA